VQFEVVHNGLSGAQHLLILPGIASSEFLRKDLKHIPSQQLLLVINPAVLHERLVHGGIAAVKVFDEESDFRHVVENPLDHSHLDGSAQARICDRDWE
jgi:hypothetical protein